MITIPTRLFTLGGTMLLCLAACGGDAKKEPTAPAPLPSTAPPEVVDAAAPVSAATPDAGATKDPQAECTALLDDANSTLDAERIAVDKLCKKDADCMPIKGHACGFLCVTGAIPKSEEKDWTEALTKVKEGACKKWEANDCAKLRTKPPPTCRDRKLWCDKGHCALKDK